MAKRASLKRPHYWFWYHTPEWRSLRRNLLKRKPYCFFCREKGRLVQATIADHTVPHKGNVKLFYDYRNLQPLCASCHSGQKRRIEQTHARQDRAMKKWITDKDGWIKRRRQTV